MPAAYIGMTLAHFGFAIGCIGIAVTATQSEELDVRMVPQQSVALGSQKVTFLGAIDVEGPNYVARQGIFVVESGDKSYELRAEKRQYLAGGNVMTEAAIRPGLFGDTYISMGESLGQGAWAIRLQYKPLVRWVWLGALLMALGGMLAALDKRYQRVRATPSVPVSPLEEPKVMG